MPRKSKSRNAGQAWPSQGGGGRRRGRAEGRGRGSNKLSYRERIRGGRIAAGNRGGCSRKLFMLLLPVIAGGAYLFLGP